MHFLGQIFTFKAVSPTLKSKFYGPTRASKGDFRAYFWDQSMLFQRVRLVRPSEGLSEGSEGMFRSKTRRRL
jgi:hypothetical protein